MDAININPYINLSQTELNRQLREAIRTENLRDITALIQNKAEIELKDSNGLTPLIWACWKGHTTAVNFLLQKNANIHATDKSGLNALMYACFCGDTTTAAFLLQNEADIHATDNSGGNALIWACRGDRTDTAAFLLQNGANIHATDNKGWNALIHACEGLHVNTAYLLLSYLTSEERDVFSTQSARHFSLVNDFKASLKTNALVSYNKIRHEQWNIEPTSIFNLLPPELRNYIRTFEAQLGLKEKFKDSWYRFHAFSDMNLAAQCCAPYSVDKPIFPVLFLSNRRKAQSEPVESNHPHKKNCPIEEEMEIEENSNKINF